MSGRYLSRATGLLCPVVLLALGGCSDIELLNPKGDIGAQERTLILLALGLMLLVVIPVIVLTLVFAWRYRASNTRATYSPNWSHSNAVEAVVWTIPCIIVLCLGVIIWRSTHSLDPYRPLEASSKPVRVDVVALNWKWLFIYPDYGIASVNQLEIPVNTPVDFKLTSASMMNSFFIPQLGSQIYAMAGMQTQLHLIANSAGTYAGRSSSFSGPGFSDMHFAAVATSRQEFDEWVRRAKASPLSLDNATYRSLEQPSIGNPVAVYTNVAPGLFEGIVKQYMGAPMEHMASNDMTTICTPQGLVQRSTN
jgi:cytochrome o ubiquinol oxidase subunit II